MAENVSIQNELLKIPVSGGGGIDSFHIHIQGLVQGVGFRPFVYNLAKHFALTGWVNNTIDGVHILFNSDHGNARLFYEELIRKAPSLSEITDHFLSKVKSRKFDSFEIVESDERGDAILMLTPDFAMCTDCKAELQLSNNFRYQYPFITCTHCGPRYSIITSLPYDRSNTSMEDFEMCEKCQAEYNDPENRRHYSQTNSCQECGIKMEIYDAPENKFSSDNVLIIDTVISGLNDGKIIAVKGIGGYLLLCDANNAETIKRLRQRKHRPAKPFAVMFPDLASIKKIAFLQKEEAEMVQSAIAPIVLVEAKENCDEQICINDIAPNLSRLGVMLPYAPLFELIVSKFGKPVVATSANISNAPIIFKDEEARQSLFSIADFVVTNNREIVVSQDDSVIQFTKKSHKQIIIRRSRGLAPSWFNYNCQTDKTILATGALLKSTFTFVNKKNTYISQYLGNTESYEVQENYAKAVQHFFDLFHQKPSIILTDKHGQYFTNQFAKELASELQIEAIEIQHHKAHFSAVLAENNLTPTPLQKERGNAPSVLGVIWDGTGLGDDDNIWGGEFFTYKDNEMKRVAHFDYFPFILGDKMPREPRISAMATCVDIPLADELLLEKFSGTEWKIYKQMLSQHSLGCSSVGRIFDAVASLLNLCDKQSYEGEAAMLLQEQASLYFNKNGWEFEESYFIENDNLISTTSLLDEVVIDIKRNKSTGFVAAKFHYSLVHLVEIIANNLQIKNIAFSGGVFLNSVLVDLLHLHLDKKFELYFHKKLSPNDENISFGQMVYYDHKIDTAEEPVSNKNELLKDLSEQV